MEIKLRCILPMLNFTLKEKRQGKVLAGLIKLWRQPSIPKVSAIPTCLLVASAAEQGVAFRATQGIFGQMLYSRTQSMYACHASEPGG